ncbi:MAG: hypothetical protein J0I12_16985, partial [Candidatus Eremiobacteraeota bacterium]|nr:hypothetical protein [Candidatus Eremiobacteraeota bacterium]
MSSRRLLSTVCVALALGATLTSVGCGSSDGGAVSSAPLPLAGNPDGTTIPTVTGRVQLGVPAADVTVTAYSLDGQLLDQTRTGPMGCFSLRQGMPANFRLVARLEDQVFAAEVRGFLGGSRGVIINVPTSLVSLAAAGALDLGPAEAQVRRILQVPDHTSLETGIEESGRGYFSHLQFFVQAGLQGGVQTFARKLLDDGVAHPFRLDRSALEAADTGLTGSLAALTSKIRRRPGLNLSLIGRIQPRAKDSPPAVLPKDAVSQFSYWLFKGVLSDAFHAGSDTVYTWTAEWLGFNHGTAVQLDEILDTVRDIQQELASLQSALSDYQFQTNVDELNKTTASLDALVGKNLRAAIELGYDPVTGTMPDLDDTPRYSAYLDTRTSTTPTVSTSIDRYLSGVAEYVAQTDLQTLTAAASGAGSVVVESFGQVRARLGLDAQPKVANLGLRSNGILDQYRLYTNRINAYQTLAVNYVAEHSHGTESAVANMRDAAANVTQTEVDQTLARHQTPPFLVSDNVMADLQNGVMWYLVAFDPATYYDARTQAKNLTLDIDGVHYDHWRLPTIGECVALQQRGRFVADRLKAAYSTPANSNAGEADTGTSLRGLSALGFVGLDARDTNNSQVFDNKGNVWYDHWFTRGGDYGERLPEAPWTLEGYHEFYVNLLNNNESTVSDGGALRPFLVCRSIGTHPLVSVGHLGQTLTLETVNPNPESPQEWVEEDIQQTEYPSLGVVSGLSNLRLNAGATNNSLDVDLTYAVNLGGDYTASQGGTSATFNPKGWNYSDTIAQSRININVLEHADVSCHPAFTTTQANVSLQNVPNNQGGYILHNSSSSMSQISAPIVATYAGAWLNGAFPSSATTNATLSFSAAPRTLTSVLVLPRNRLYTFPTDLENQSDVYQVLAFYSDLSVEDVTNSPDTVLNVTGAGQTSLTGAVFTV